MEMKGYMRSYLSETESVVEVECCECGLVHNKGDRVAKEVGNMEEYTCPNCGDSSYYNRAK